jgi:hypothetical protein
MKKIGILGAGNVSRKTALALLEDHYEAIEGVKRLVLPIPTGEIEDLSPVVGYAAAWAMSLNVDYDVVLPQGVDAVDKKIEEIVDNAVAVHRTAKVSLGLVRSLEQGDDLLLAWDDEDKECMRALIAADKNGINAKDICDGLTDLVVGDGEDDDDTESTPVEQAPTFAEIPEVTAIRQQVQQILDTAVSQILDIVERSTMPIPDPVSTRTPRKSRAKQFIEG